MHTGWTRPALRRGPRRRSTSTARPVYVHVHVGRAPHPRPRRTRDSATSTLRDACRAGVQAGAAEAARRGAAGGQPHDCVLQHKDQVREPRARVPLGGHLRHPRRQGPAAARVRAAAVHARPLPDDVCDGRRRARPRHQGRHQRDQPRHAAGRRRRRVVRPPHRPQRLRGALRLVGTFSEPSRNLL